MISPMRQAVLDHLVHCLQVLADHLDPPVLQGHQEQMVPLAMVDLDQRVNEETMDLQEQVEGLPSLDHKELPVPLEPQDLQGMEDRQEDQARQEAPDILDQRDSREMLEDLDQE